MTIVDIIRKEGNALRFVVTRDNVAFISGDKVLNVQYDLIATDDGVQYGI